jgi:hypothetical protein
MINFPSQSGGHHPQSLLSLRIAELRRPAACKVRERKGRLVDLQLLTTGTDVILRIGRSTSTNHRGEGAVDKDGKTTMQLSFRGIDKPV